MALHCRCCSYGKEKRISMRIIINAINLTAAGTLTTGKQFLKALVSVDNYNEYLVVVPNGYGFEDIYCNGNFRFKFYPRIKGFYRFWRVYQDILGFRGLVHEFKADAVLALGNISPVNLGVPTLVLMRNSHYVDMSSSKNLGKIEKFIKKLEMIFFYMTTKQADLFIVQSEYMRKRLSEKWLVSNDIIKIIPNALSDNIKLYGVKPISMTRLIPDIYDSNFKVLYVSRYYPHKNHSFIIEIAKYFQNKNIKNIVFFLTLDEKINGVKKLLNEINKNNLNDYIYNIGEVLQSELINWYKYSDLLFFPSDFESFGNAFIEAMNFGLPICAVNLSYAKSICQNAALYYKQNSVEDAARKILMIKSNSDFRAKMSDKSRERLTAFPSWEEVARQYLHTIKEIVNR
ncbi:glycosyltransferase [Candidatus Poribacteria bacterium]|nr:glycosyltransferase [Candidatus Poribacteria bacterium]